MLLLTREDILRVCDMKEAIEADKLAFRLAAENAIDLPLRTVIEKDSSSSFVFMPAYSRDIQSAAVKSCNIFPGNLEKGLPTAPAEVILMDGNNGLFLAMLEGNTLTQIRTGASTGAAFDVLGKKECHIGGMIGTGNQAATQLEAMICARDLDEVRIFDLNQERCASFCTSMQEKLADYNTRFIPVSSADEACEDADLFVTITPSPVPVFDGTKIKPGATVSCVGTFQPDKHEMDPAVLPRASKIFCDLKEAALAETGDLLIPIQEGLITEDDISGSLGEVINGKIPGRENDDEIIVYETVGIAAQDLITARVIYDRAMKEKIGTQWS